MCTIPHQANLVDINLSDPMQRETFLAVLASILEHGDGCRIVYSSPFSNWDRYWLSIPSCSMLFSFASAANAADLWLRVVPSREVMNDRTKIEALEIVIDIDYNSNNIAPFLLFLVDEMFDDGKLSNEDFLQIRDRVYQTQQ